MNGNDAIAAGAEAAAAPVTPRTRMSYRVPYADTDQMAVVYYANYFVYFERVRNEVLRERGITYKEMESAGFLLPVVEAHCDYRQPARYDDALVIEGWFEPVSATRIKAHCEITRDGALLARGHTLHVVISAGSRRPVRLPADMVERVFGPAA